MTTETNGGRIVLRFEGRLAGDWVREAEAAWLQTSAPGSAVIVDLCEVSAVDAAGRQLLARAHRAGAELRARGCAMRELVREIVEDDDLPGRTGTDAGVNGRGEERA